MSSQGSPPVPFCLAQIFQGLKSLGNGLCTLTNWAQNVICVHTCKQGGLMCRIWDWQSTIVKDLNDSQDHEHSLFCRENASVVIYAIFSDNQCALSTRLEGGGGRQKGTMWLLFTFFYIRASLNSIVTKSYWVCESNLIFDFDFDQKDTNFQVCLILSFGCDRHFFECQERLLGVLAT